MFGVSQYNIVLSNVLNWKLVGHHVHVMKNLQEVSIAIPVLFLYTDRYSWGTSLDMPSQQHCSAKGDISIPQN